MRSRAWWVDKANSLAPAAASVPFAGLVALLAVATHETECGDDWPDSHNWGATTRGLLSTAEHAQLTAAHVVPVLQPLAAREASEAAAMAVLGVRDDREIHVDSRPSRMSPTPGGMLTNALPRMGFLRLAQARALLLPSSAQIVYFTWFAKFATDVEGAAYFASFFRTAAEHAAIAAGDSDALSRAMFAAHYYTGFSADAETDIEAYANALRPLVAEATHALVGWSPGADPPAVTEPSTPDLGDPAQLQAALNAAGASPPLVVDGILGQHTRDAVSAFQRAHGLAVDGVAGAATLAALRVAGL